MAGDESDVSEPTTCELTSTIRELKLTDKWRWILKPQELRVHSQFRSWVKQRDKWFQRLRWSSCFGNQNGWKLCCWVEKLSESVFQWTWIRILLCLEFVLWLIELHDDVLLWFVLFVYGDWRWNFLSVMFCLMLKSKWNMVRRFLSAWEGKTEAEWSPGGALALQWILVSGSGGLAWWLGFGW